MVADGLGRIADQCGEDVEAVGAVSARIFILRR
jgi:hypothetical protein